MSEEERVRIAFIVNNYPPRTGGVELHVQSLAKELTRRGHEVLVVTLGDVPGWSTRDSINILTLREHARIANILGFPSLGTKRRLKKLLQERGVDVVSVHTRFFPMSYLGMRAATTAKIPLIHTEHGSDHVASDSALIRFASRMVDFTLGRAVLRRATQVLGVSEAVTDFVYRLAGVKAEVFYNAIDVDQDTGQTTRQPGSRPHHLVFVGRLVAGKGWDTFLEVAAAARAEFPNLTAEVLGNGSDMPKLKELVTSLNLSDIVTIRGQVSQGEVRQALQGATLVNPTLLSEGFQTTLLEAVYAGGQVVTYPVPGAAVLRDQGANLTISEQRDASALVQALSHAIQDQKPPATPELIAHWTWPARAEQFEGVCARALGHTN